MSTVAHNYIVRRWRGFVDPTDLPTAVLLLASGARFQEHVDLMPNSPSATEVYYDAVHCDDSWPFARPDDDLMQWLNITDANGAVLDVFEVTHTSSDKRGVFVTLTASTATTSTSPRTHCRSSSCNAAAGAVFRGLVRNQRPPHPSSVARGAAAVSRALNITARDALRFVAAQIRIEEADRLRERRGDVERMHGERARVVTVSCFVTQKPARNRHQNQKTHPATCGNGFLPVSCFSAGGAAGSPTGPPALAPRRPPVRAPTQRSGCPVAFGDCQSCGDVSSHTSSVKCHMFTI